MWGQNFLPIQNQELISFFFLFLGVGPKFPYFKKVIFVSIPPPEKKKKIEGGCEISFPIIN
jgi:hypothetical protein